MRGPARRALFRGGPTVAPLALGTMMFADRTDEDEAARILEGYLAAGGDVIDTADSYADGGSERMLGRLLRRIGPARDDLVIATKVGNPLPSVAGSGGLSARRVREAAAQSLERLGLERIDLYWLHLDDEAIPLEETIGALAELIAAGAVRWWGFSNYRAWKVAEMIRVADRLGAPRPVAAQPYYHALNRLAEIDTLPACAHFGLGVLPYSTLARGVLTGKYRGGAAPEGSRAARGDKRIAETELRPETLAAAARIADHAEATGRSPTAFALAWSLANRTVSSLLVGPRTRAQLDAYLEALGAPFDARDEALVDALCPSGCAPAALYADPRYPYRGRAVGLEETAP